MICPTCSAPLPDESLFCPYCMTKFGAENKKSDKSRKQNAVKITAAVIAFLLLVSVIVVFLIKSKTAKGERCTSAQTQSTVEEQSTENNISDQTEKTSGETETAEINGEYYEPGTYFWNINGNGEIVLEDYENYPF